MKDKEKTIYLSNVESSALVIQAILVGTRMELLDLLDYAKENSIDSVPVQHIQEEVIGLRQLEEEEYSHREKCYLEAHENTLWKSCKEELPKEGQYVIACNPAFQENEAEVSYFAAVLSRYWISKDLQCEIEDTFRMKSGKEIYVISGSPFAKDVNGDYYEVDDKGEPCWYWMDLNTRHICDTLDVDHDYWMPFTGISEKILKGGGTYANTPGE